MLPLRACAHAPHTAGREPLSQHTPETHGGSPLDCGPALSRGAAGEQPHPQDPRPTGLGGEGPCIVPRGGGRRGGGGTRIRQPPHAGAIHTARGEAGALTRARTSAPSRHASIRSFMLSFIHSLVPLCVYSFVSAFIHSRAHLAPTPGQGLSQDNALKTPVQPYVQITETCKPKRPPADGWIRKTWCGRTAEPQPAREAKGILPCVATWTDLDGISPSELNQRKTNTL